MQVKLRDPHLSALEVKFSRRGAKQIYVYLYLYLYLRQALLDVGSFSTSNHSHVSTLFGVRVVTFCFFRLQASLHELVIDESDPGPARLILYTNLPITCQGVTRTNSPTFCWIKFAITSSDDVSMRQRLPHDVPSTGTKNLCTYELHEQDWKPNERRSYDSNRSLDIVAKVDVDTENVHICIETCAYNVISFLCHIKSET